MDGNVDKVVIEIVADQGSYPSITRNGIKSQSYKKAKGAFKIIGVPVTEVTDPDISKYRDKEGEMVKVRVTGRTTGTIWGMNSGWGYMDKSDLATAAVHAGKLQPGQTGTLLVRVKGPNEKHEAAVYNGIQSRSYGKSEGCFKIRSCVDVTPIDQSSTQTSTTKTTNNTTNTNNTATTNTSAKQIISDGVYYIKCAGDPNYVITLKNSKATSGNEIVVRKKKNSNDQKWKVENLKDGSIIIRSMVNEKYAAHVKSNEVGEWTKITSNLYGGKKNERWIPEKTG